MEEHGEEEHGEGSARGPDIFCTGRVRAVLSRFKSSRHEAMVLECDSALYCVEKSSTSLRSVKCRNKRSCSLIAADNIVRCNLVRVKACRLRYRKRSYGVGQACAPWAARWLCERRRVPQKTAFPDRAVGLKFV